MKTKSTYSAPVALSLAGEFGVIYGKPLLVCASDFRVKVSFDTEETKKSRAFQIDNIIKEIKNYYANEAIPLPRKKYPYISITGTNMIIDEGIIAQTVCTVAGLLAYLFDTTPDPTVVNKITCHLTKKREIDPYSVMTSCSTLGGLIYFRKEFEFMPYLSQLTFKIPPSIEKGLYIIDPKINKSANKGQKFIKEVHNDLERFTKRIVVAMMKEDVELFKDSMSKAERLSEKLDAVPKTICHIINDIENVGGVGKIILSERSLYVMVYGDERMIQTVSTTYGIGYYKFHQSQQGIRLQNNHEASYLH